MIPHKVLYPNKQIFHYKNKEPCSEPYGVSLASRVLSPQALLRKFDHIRIYLKDCLHLSTTQREVVFAMLTLWCYYGKVYPKERQITDEAYCSKPTFWRTITLLRSHNLITVVNRYIMREHAQISNVYLLDKLVYAIAKYLSEYGYKSASNLFSTLCAMNGSLFWRTIYTPAFALSPPG